MNGEGEDPEWLASLGKGKENPQWLQDAYEGLVDKLHSARVYAEGGEPKSFVEDVKRGLNMGMQAMGGGPHPAIMMGPVGISRMTGVAASDIPELTSEMTKYIKSNPEKAWQQQRAFLGREGLPRIEAPDTGAKLVQVAAPPGSTLPHFKLEHPSVDVHDIYNIPPIREDPTLARGVLGSTDRRTGQISLAPEEKMRRYLGSKFDPTAEHLPLALHEITHPIQRAEGFDPGSSALKSLFHPEFYKLMGMNEPKPGSVLPEMLVNRIQQARSGRVDPFATRMDEVADQIYRKGAGETEARNVAYRFLNPNKYATHPDFTADVPPDQQLLMRALGQQP